METPWEFNNNNKQTFIEKKQKALSILNESYAKKWILMQFSYANIPASKVYFLGKLTDLQLKRLIIRNQAFYASRFQLLSPNFEPMKAASKTVQHIEEHFHNLKLTQSISPDKPWWNDVVDSYSLYTKNLSFARDFEEEQRTFWNEKIGGFTTQQNKNKFVFAIKPNLERDLFDFEMSVKNELEEIDQIENNPTNLLDEWESIENDNFFQDYIDSGFNDDQSF